MKTIKTMFTPLLKENSMKHIDYKTFNSIQVFEWCDQLKDKIMVSGDCK